MTEAKIYNLAQWKAAHPPSLMADVDVPDVPSFVEAHCRALVLGVWLYCDLIHSIRSTSRNTHCRPGLHPGIIPARAFRMSASSLM